VADPTGPTTMTTFFEVAAWASGAEAVVAVTISRAAKTPVNSDRRFLDDARWAPGSLSGNRRASPVPERRSWGCGDGGNGGRRRRGGAHGARRVARDAWQGHRPKGWGGRPEDGRLAGRWSGRTVTGSCLTTALRLSGLSAIG